eukprot:CAMPEP_0116925680 /NCGR_PEP_ID=MMETSP0467-20121206/24266_1 /TAXON_ID=283647 /ORGANISM="Mesodinium pulex, Strain SPMC105" /LENGTH=85 /DNA_ID=CAMNT_0004604777 /DNA_START=1759 /DNA_END=2016 /DNA_ORIENTATION=-
MKYSRKLYMNAKLIKRRLMKIKKYFNMKKVSKNQFKDLDLLFSNIILHKPEELTDIMSIKNAFKYQFNYKKFKLNFLDTTDPTKI